MFAPDYQDLPRTDRLAYVVAELRRIDAAGEPILRTVLSCADSDVTDVAMKLLHANTDENEDPVIPARLWRLRLVEGAKPPESDPQGRKIDAAKRGKVLMAKVGVKGTTPAGLEGPALAKHIDAHSGPRRAIKANAKADLYNLVEITRSPVMLPLRQCVIILRAWGDGIGEQYRRELTKEGEPRQGQCQWLVEEVSEEEASRLRDEELSKTRAKRAA